MNKPTPAAGTPRAPTQVLSISPVVLPASGRPVDLQMRISAPVVGSGLPVLLLSHGHGPSNFVSSLYGYAPLANHFAGHGFVVIQPTHLDSKTLPFRTSDHPDAPLFWRSRADDMTRIIDQLDAIERAVPAIAGRMDRDKVAVLGHSMGGHTASVLLGARHTDGDGKVVSAAEPRIKAGVLLAAPGRGDGLSAYAREHYSFFSTIDFSTMTAPALVVAGDKDGSPHLTTAGAAWHADPFVLSPSPKSLVLLFGAEHGLGGIAGYDLAETTDEDPARAAAVARLACAFLQSALYAGAPDWQEAQKAVLEGATPLGQAQSK